MPLKNNVNIICDPVHGMMKFDDDIYSTIKKVIDHPLFQRLRHIKQLSFAEFAYPGAVHTRFNHCLGTAYLASKVAENICPEANIIITLSALLHDIGHGPFSHAFEDIYDSKYKINHEDWTDKFIENLTADLKVIERELKAARDILKSPDNKYHNIISSQLDVDRFDYLLRDSHFCGVSYGHFDVDWLISCLKIHDNKLAILPKGLKTLEHYLMARRTMNHNVYLHKKSCAGSYVFKHFSRIIKNNIHLMPESLNHINFIKYIRALNIAQKEIIDPESYKEKAINELYDTYKNLNENEIWHLMHLLTNKEIFIKNELFFVALRDAALCMLHRDLPKVYQLCPGIYDSVSEKINEQMSSCSKDIQEICNLYIGVERPKFYAYKSNGEDSNIYMVEYNEQDVPFPICDVATYSENIKFYMNKGEEIAYLYDLDTPNIPLELKNIKAKLMEELYDKGCFVPWEKPC